MWSDSDGEKELTPNEVGPGRHSTSSEVVVVDERVAAEVPSISQLNVSHKSKVHLGPKFVSVTQNVNNAEMVKTRFLGLEMISARNTLRCSIAVFVCWALVVAIGLAVYFFLYTLPNTQTRLDLGIKEPWYLRRGDWQAMPPYRMTFLNLPVSYVLIGHSATTYCEDQYSCIQSVLDIQADHLRRDWDDIGPNFLVSGNGLIFEGRGANVNGAMVRWWNAKSITIMFLGDYSKNKTKLIQFEHVNVLLSVLEQHKVLTEDYVLMGHCQVAPLIISPGKNIMRELKYFKHWNSNNQTKYLPLPCYIWQLIRSTSRVERLWCLAALVGIAVILSLILYFTGGGQDLEDVAPHEWNITREMWLAKKYETPETTIHFEPLRLVVVQHSVSQECHRFITCAAELRTLQSWNIRDCPCDIAYNFLIGNDGRVYEGRGWRKVGAHTRKYNRCAFGIGFIGDYREEIHMHSTVTPLQLNRTLMLLDYGVERGYLHRDYFVVGAKDISDTASPGSNLYNAIRKWPHYNNGDNFRNRSCEEIYSKFTD